MNYIDEVAYEIGRRVDAEWPTVEEKRLLRIYAVLCLSKGAAVCSSDVHDAWVAWAIDNNPAHKSIKPFAELSIETQRLDDRYATAIVAVAAGRK